MDVGALFDDRYELVSFIGSGSFAEVWLVRDTQTELLEALKIYTPGSGIDQNGTKLFVKELAVVHDLHHTNLLTPKISGLYENRPYLVLSYCPNGSLSGLIGQCTEDKAWKIIEQVAAGLAYLHEHQIIHRDIKPGNILLDVNNVCVITDFGISLRLQSTLRKSVTESSGTIAYMAPECFAEARPEPANDIWSLGAMMFELIEGGVPFVPLMGGLAQLNGARIPQLHANVSNNLKALITSLLSLDPKKRPVAQDLVELAKKRKASDKSSLFSIKFPSFKSKDKSKPFNSKPTEPFNKKQEHVSLASNVRYCRKCGQLLMLEPDSLYCRYCGQVIT